MVLSSWLNAIARVHLVYLMNADCALGGCQPLDQANKIRLRIRRYLAATIYIHHRHLLLLPSPKADTHFTMNTTLFIRSHQAQHVNIQVYVPDWSSLTA